VLPFFRKLESDKDHAGPLHGQDGPLPIGRVTRPHWPSFSRALAQGMEQAGWRDIEDQNAVFEDGYFAAAYTNFDVATPAARRATAAMVYLPPAVRRRANLTIIDRAFVTGLVMEGVRATGVAYERDGATAMAQGAEVILAAGALHSPAMLMRAGIGPRDELERHGIPVRLAREGVGRNLRDHPGTHLCAYVPPAHRLPPGLRKSGHVALRFSSGLAGAPVSDLYMHSGATSGWHGVGQRIAYFYLWVNKPHSTGRVTLRGTDPREHPRVEMNLLAEPADVVRLAEGFRRVAALLRQPVLDGVAQAPFAVRFSPFIRFMAQVTTRNRLAMGLLGRMLDGPAWLRRLLLRTVITNAPSIDRLLADPALLEDYLRRNAMSVSHVSCTCRMGHADDPLAVTDSEGRVHGAERLRIADASIMPTLPRANTNLATIMIAEKLADAILRQPPHKEE
jgi:5-(hydroxymethyl)furfural/furfural oxidase